MDDPNHPLGADTWKRGVWLGIAVLGLFVVSAGILYLLGTLIGMSTTTSALCGIFVGPFLGSGLFYAYWKIRQPSIIPPPPERRPVMGNDTRTASEMPTLMDARLSDLMDSPEKDADH